MPQRYINRIKKTNRIKIDLSDPISIERNRILGEEMEKNNRRIKYGERRDYSSRTRNACGFEDGMKRLQMIRTIHPYFKDGRGGQRKFDDPDHLWSLVEQYFDSCYRPLVDEDTGRLKKDEFGNILKVLCKPLTVSGLSLATGLTSKQIGRYIERSYNGEDDPYYGEILTYALTRIEEYMEERLYDKESTSGAQFALRFSRKWTTAKEDSDIKNNERKLMLAEQEHELKKKLIEEGEDGDTAITVNIVRALPKDGG